MLHKATRDTEAGKAAPAAVTAAVERLTGEMSRAGVLHGVITLAPSVRGTRFHLHRTGRPRVTDGPFAESKELIGGFGLFDLPSLEAARELCVRYGELMLKSVETLELDLRLVADG